MDSNGLECDSVIHLRNGKYGLVVSMPDTWLNVARHSEV